MFHHHDIHRTVSLSLCALLAVAAVAAPAMASDVDHRHAAGYDFSSLHTYDWLPVRDTALIEPGGAVDRQIRSAVEERLAKRGFEPAREGGADFLLHYEAGLRERADVSGAERHLHGGSDGPRVTFAWEEGEQSRIYTEGTLVIEVLDADTREVVWVGWATEVAREPALLRKKVDRTVKRILRPFPPKSR